MGYLGHHQMDDPAPLAVMDDNNNNEFEIQSRKSRVASKQVSNQPTSITIHPFTLPFRTAS